MKTFKKIIKNGSSVQCLHCAQSILIAIFPQHLIQCAKIDINVSQIMLNSGRNNFGKGQEYGAKSTQSPQLVIQGSYERVENVKRATNEAPKMEENNLESMNKEKLKKQFIFFMNLLRIHIILIYLFSLILLFFVVVLKNHS